MKPGRKIKRLMMILPPTRARAETIRMCMPPLGAAYIAASVRDLCDVEILDATTEGYHIEEIIGDGFVRYGLSYDEIISRIEKFKPDMIGITCLFSAVFPVVRELTERIKKCDPNIIVGAGGTHPTFLPDECMRGSKLDFIGLGEGEETMRSLIGALDRGGIEDIDGLAWRDEDGAIRIRPKIKYIDDLDSLPYPARGLLPMELYPRRQIPHSLGFRHRRLANIFTSRGCHCKCIFCSSTHFWGPKWRPRSPDNVLDEIQELIADWGIREIQFEDDNMTANRERAQAIFRGIIDRKLDIRFNFPNGVALWTLDEKTIDLMAEAGCYETVLAYESGVQSVLDCIVHKPMKLDRALHLTRHFQKSGIRTLAFYIVGFPGETLEQVKSTFKFASAADTDMAYFFTANPLPGSTLYKMVKENGWLKPGFNFENNSFSRLPYNTPDWRAEDVEKLAAREFLIYSLRSIARHPLTMGRKIIMDVMLKRPGYILDTLKRFIKRNLGGQNQG